MKTTDPSDRTSSPVAVIRWAFGGAFRDGETSWVGRRDPLLTILSQMVDGQPALMINPGEDTVLLRRALAGDWFYARTASAK
mgnify:CR=1 FL=1|jgi:hypothetical protein